MQCRARLHYLLKDDLMKLDKIKNPMDGSYKRIQYVRYADDFLIGVIGSKSDAEQIKSDIGKFFTEHLKLELSEEKTLITNSKDKARFLGYDVIICNDNSLAKVKGRGTTRIYTNKIKLYLPKDKWIGKLLNYGVLKVVSESEQKEVWKPLQRDEYIFLPPHEIVRKYNAQIRGIYNYYRLASNVSVLNKFYYVMEYSMYKTLAAKYRITMTKAKMKFTKDREFKVPYKTKKGTKYAIFYNNGFRKVKSALGSYTDIIPEYEQMNKPKELFFRYEANVCEMCSAYSLCRLRQSRKQRLIENRQMSLSMSMSRRSLMLQKVPTLLVEVLVLSL